MMFVSICLWIFFICKTHSQTTQSPFDKTEEHVLITEDLLRIYSDSNVTYHSLWNRLGFNGHDKDDNRRRDIIDDWDIFPPVTVHFLYCDTTIPSACTEDEFKFKVTIDVEKYAPSGNISKWDFGKCDISQASGTVSNSQCSFVDSNIIVAGNFKIDHSGDHFHLKDAHGQVQEADYFVLGAVYNETVCPCDCIYHEKVEAAKNKTRQKKSVDELKAELAPQLKEMQKNLTVDTSTLSAFINRKVSKGDERKSSKQIGAIGIVFLTVELSMLVVVDMISFGQRWACLKRLGKKH